MNLNEYQKLARKYAKYPSRNRFKYPVMGLSDEISELAGKLTKVFRDTKDDKITDDIKNDISKEIGDCFWFICTIASEYKEEIENYLEPCMCCLFAFYNDNLESENSPIFESAYNSLIIWNDEVLDRFDIEFLHKHLHAVSNLISIVPINWKSDRNKIFWTLSIPFVLIFHIMKNLNLNLDDILQQNLDKLESRFQRNVIGGSGDNR